MFPFPIAKPQNCDIQTFYGPGTSALDNKFTWAKPVGVSHVYMLLIGAGGNGDITGTGGGSGAVTVWYGAAQHVPPNLQLVIGGAEQSAFVYAYTSASGGRSSLLRASAGVGATAGAAVTAGPFAASGFYKSTAGQNGSSSAVTASSTTFLSGGGPNGDPVTANYGYSLTGLSGNFAGSFQMQPIIVGLGSKGIANGAIGCGGGVQASFDTGYGGPGMVLIASW
jgi:hypothetical protein